MRITPLLVASVLSAGGYARQPGPPCPPRAAWQPPSGWLAAGSRPGDYVMGPDSAVTRGGRPTLRVRTVAASPSGFGTMMQALPADELRGRRVRISGDIRVSDVVGFASLWMRVDDACGNTLGFDNAMRRAARGTADWSPMQVVLDVPADAQTVSLGVLLVGAGTVWVSGLQLDTVPESVPVTSSSTPDSVRRDFVPFDLDALRRGRRPER